MWDSNVYIPLKLCGQSHLQLSLLFGFILEVIQSVTLFFHCQFFHVYDYKVLFFSKKTIVMVMDLEKVLFILSCEREKYFNMTLLLIDCTKI